MKKIISILLSVTLLCSAFCIGSIAAEEKPYFVVLGDSIAYGSGLSNSKNACYGKIIADTNGYEYVNHSVPGHTTANLINRLSQEEVIEDIKKAGIISISIGGNDFLMSNLMSLMFKYIVMGDMSEYDNIEKGFYVNFCIIIDMINELNEDAVILVQTIYNPQFGYLEDAYLEGGVRLNNCLEEYSFNNPGEIVIVDVASELNGDPKNFASDGIHPSAKGNEIIAVEILKTLNTLKLGKNIVPVIIEEGIDINVSPIFTVPMEIMGVAFHAIGLIVNFVTDLISA